MSLGPYSNVPLQAFRNRCRAWSARWSVPGAEALQQSPYVTVQQCQLVASVTPLLSSSFDLIIRYSKLTHCLLSSVSCASPGPEMAPESGSAFACASPHAPARPAQEFGCPCLNGSPDATSIRVPTIAPLIQELALERETKCNKLVCESSPTTASILQTFGLCLNPPGNSRSY